MSLTQVRASILVLGLAAAVFVSFSHVLSCLVYQRVLIGKLCALLDVYIYFKHIMLRAVGFVHQCGRKVKYLSQSICFIYSALDFFAVQSPYVERLQTVGIFHIYIYTYENVHVPGALSLSICAPFVRFSSRCQLEGLFRFSGAPFPAGARSIGARKPLVKITSRDAAAQRSFCSDFSLKSQQMCKCSMPLKLFLDDTRDSFAECEF